mmetsp:Transcript_18305/g.33188  ORF Transcript_18305/g.33188 Transcript_18305/m.33188 type:complete len:286 (-) Transcript_18305:113-970(-)
MTHHYDGRRGRRMGQSKSKSTVLKGVMVVVALILCCGARMGVEGFVSRASPALFPATASYTTRPAASSSSLPTRSMPSVVYRYAVEVDQENSQEADAQQEKGDTDMTMDNEEEEWEYVEYEMLKEKDFVGSEWRVGTVMERSPQKIEETWVRLVTTVQDGLGGEKVVNVAYWGDGRQGKWNLDVASQFLSISKETWGGWLGKQIWAGAVEDYYFLEGTVRGWSPVQPASVLGEWQSKRLGVDPSESGTPPWFQEQNESNDDDDEREENDNDTTSAMKEENSIFPN